MAHQLITISGELGSGKSTVATMLAEKLGYAYYSTGMAQRHIADLKGLSTLQLNELSQTDPSIDKEIDGIYKKKPWGKKPCVVDSRLAFHFLPDSFKIKLKVNLKVAAKRVFDEKRPHEKYQTLKQAQEFLQKRAELEKERFITTYQIDISDDSLFDLVIDTSALSPEEVCQKIIQAL